MPLGLVKPGSLIDPSLTCCKTCFHSSPSTSCATKSFVRRHCASSFDHWYTKIYQVGNFWDDNWETWTGKSRRQLVQKCQSAKITVFAASRSILEETKGNRTETDEPEAKRHCGSSMGIEQPMIPLEREAQIAKEIKANFMGQCSWN